jgi:hypothetical protein
MGEEVYWRETCTMISNGVFYTHFRSFFGCSFMRPLFLTLTQTQKAGVYWGHQKFESYPFCCRYDPR